MKRSVGVFGTLAYSSVLKKGFELRVGTSGSGAAFEGSGLTVIQTMVWFLFNSCKPTFGDMHLENIKVDNVRRHSRKPSQMPVANSWRCP
jgi:hypothetical protein